MAHLSKLNHTTDALDSIKSDAIAIGLFEDGTLTSRGKSVDKTLNGQISVAYKRNDIKGKEGEMEIFYSDQSPVIVIGLGKSKDFNNESIRKVGGSLAKKAITKKYTHIACENFGGKGTADFGQALAEGLILGSYQFNDYLTKKKDELFELKKVTVSGGSHVGLSKGAEIAKSVCFARDLGNHPGNVSTPSRLANDAKKIGRKGKMKVSVFDREKFTEIGMGGLAGVAAGTDEPPKFILMEYWGTKKSVKPKVLVGKGLTFDSGGISIKPASKMDEMKFDMCGSAVVLGCMHAIAALKPKINVVAAISSTENMSGSKAYKPGDILTAYNGKTIEVLNTDAEGRLILADALSYVSKHYDPAFIFDFATLTGAVIIALGHIATGIMGTDEKLIEKVKKSSARTGEKVWEFPLWEEYCEQVQSRIADVKNMGSPGQAGTIAGGAFLKEFVREGIPWCHFDIAGTAWDDIAGTAWDDKEKPYGPKAGATGNVIRLVLDAIGL
ncbi:MAG: leucyl aminopeptidase [Candidatus Marinimicrobia bacterium]|jgi:leucyl aminopeptidase|nr:leucyl aminopeptidase [Candidatus Neomarinimicrobiota bacterium]MDP6500431.1 leucyl aminopeptidase [Candidatus Neomarinimicrobiota bacterium]MDP6726649.1 leucyl aminopeptidase [Candidatus Neomarinimicrobiota bacterium]|tara:strand:- start:10893 stop:12386 length:1494 start_codon:yes stop_codon:yes gene_type:complete